MLAHNVKKDKKKKKKESCLALISASSNAYLIWAVRHGELKYQNK